MEHAGFNRTGLKTLVFLGLVVGLLSILHHPDENGAGDLIAVSKRKPMAEISLSDLGGNRWRLANHKGEVVLLNFWASWCGPCREETPALVRIAQSYAGRGVAVLGVAMDEGGSEAVRKFASEYRISYPVALPDSHFLLARSVGALPTTLLIDREGRLAKMYVGGASESAFRADVESLLREGAGGDEKHAGMA
jgi:thiol-disulfide isomerase/thioredoxin